MNYPINYLVEISHFGETINGAPTIRAYNVVDRFIEESEKKVDFNQMCYYPTFVSSRWLSVRLETIGNLIILFASLFAVIARDTMDPGKVCFEIHKKSKSPF